MQSQIKWTDINGARMLAIGECMIELSRRDGEVNMGYAGDSLNTTLYLARLLNSQASTVSYLTALGDDPFSQEMQAGWAQEGIDTTLVQTIPGSLPGLYWIDTDDAGERSFHYWREQSAAKRVFKVLKDPASVLDQFALIYYSGITLAILDETDRELLFELVQACREHGTRIVFDPNYRPRLWHSGDEAKACFQRAWANCDVALTGFDDEQAVFGDDSARTSCDRILAAGAQEVVITQAGAETRFASCEGQSALSPPALEPVDTTGAGDAFNAAYIAARLQGADMNAAVAQAQALAGLVIMSPGAILRADQMPSTLVKDHEAL